MGIANVRGVPGTVGLLGRSSSGERCFLTSQHVLYGRGGAAGDPVWILNESNGHAITEFGRTITGQIGRVSLDDRLCFVDCAIGLLAEPAQLPATVRSALDQMGQVRRTAVAKVGSRVMKWGASTGLTTGIVIDISHFDRPFSEGRVYGAPNQILIRSEDSEECFSAPGDSGGALLDEDGSVLGLLWGSNISGEGIVCPIEPVLDCLGVTLEGARG